MVKLVPWGLEMLSVVFKIEEDQHNFFEQAGEPTHGKRESGIIAAESKRLLGVVLEQGREGEVVYIPSTVGGEALTASRRLARYECG